MQIPTNNKLRKRDLHMEQTENCPSVIYECEPDCGNERCENEGTTFRFLFADFIAGAPIKRKCWRGYWKYRFGEIEMHCKDGTVTMFSETKDVLYTLSGILQNDWEIATKYNCDIPVK